jgi:RimJ/RimL family protein N-acetyltransferase
MYFLRRTKYTCRFGELPTRAGRLLHRKAICEEALMMAIREIQESDAAAYLELGRQLDAETAFMMLEPGERTTSTEQQRERIRTALASPNSATFVVADGGRLVGVLGATGGAYRRNRHCAHLFIGVLQAYCGQGLGTRLFVTAERWARAKGLRRLELTVMVHNQAGIALYRKMGFIVEGLRKDSLLVNGNYIDEYYMVKILD